MSNKSGELLLSLRCICRIEELEKAHAQLNGERQRLQEDLEEVQERLTAGHSFSFFCLYLGNASPSYAVSCIDSLLQQAAVLCVVEHFHYVLSMAALSAMFASLPVSHAIACHHCSWLA